MSYNIGDKIKFHHMPKTNKGEFITATIIKIEEYETFPTVYTVESKDGTEYCITDSVIVINPEPYITEVCYHSWKQYIGITEVFDYCEDCGKKREEVERLSWV